MCPMHGPHFSEGPLQNLVCVTQHSVDGQLVCSAPSMNTVLGGWRNFTQNTDVSFYNAEDDPHVLQRC